MRIFPFALLVLLIAGSLPASAQQPQLPAGYWPLSETRPILEQTATIRLAPDLSSLTPEERSALDDLLAVGAIMQKLYEESRHHQARSSLRELEAMHARLGEPQATRNLLDLYRLNQGPIATSLDNRRLPFLPVDPQVPGRNVYPWGITKDEIESFLSANPDQRDEILGERTVVRRATGANLQSDLATLDRHPVLATLHPELEPKLTSLTEEPDPSILYAVPYAVAWADDLVEAHRLLRRAARSTSTSDAEFARFLDNRARDLLSNDYESGDASWVTGNFNRFNAQLGAYETYDDSLYGIKAFHSLSLLLLDEPATGELRRALGGLQEVENLLPYEHRKRVREEIPVGVYHVIADFGQSRGTNTATILPNDPLFSKRYGRTILLRENIMTHPEIYEASLAGWKAAVAPELAGDLVPEGNFYRTLWHEIGHYLGVERDAAGRTLDLALQEHADALEEMKADLVSLFALHHLHEKGEISDARLRAVQASGIRRTLQNNRPRPDQPYQTMQLAQFNFFLEREILGFDRSNRLTIDYSRYQETVTELLQEVLAIQHSGDRDRAAAFFDRWTSWDDTRHGAIAERMRNAPGARFRIVRYEALGE
jgi:hypothetical protein